MIISIMRSRARFGPGAGPRVSLILFVCLFIVIFRVQMWVRVTGDTNRCGSTSSSSKPKQIHAL